MVLPKAVRYYWGEGSNSTFVILLNSSTEIPRLQQSLLRETYTITSACQITD